MSKTYETPPELRELEKLISEFTYNNGYDISRVFDDLLTFIVHGFSPGAPPLENWKYNSEQNRVFYAMYCKWIEIMNRQINIRSWYDVFGELYMALIVSPKQAQSSGQFFTPAHICDLMTCINSSEHVMTNAIGSDPTCGSGRMLISFHVKHPGNYLIGEDIDCTCCMMAVCNFLIHGGVGEVIWHNSLDPESYFGGWKVNESLTLTGIPSARTIPKEESHVWQHWQAVKSTKTQ